MSGGAGDKSYHHKKRSSIIDDNDDDAGLEIDLDEPYKILDVRNQDEMIFKFALTTL